MSKSDVKALQESQEREEEVMLTSAERNTVLEEPREMRFCPHFVAELKGATDTCPNCGKKL